MSWFRIFLKKLGCLTTRDRSLVNVVVFLIHRQTLIASVTMRDAKVVLSLIRSESTLIREDITGGDLFLVLEGHIDRDRCGQH